VRLPGRYDLINARLGRDVLLWGLLAGLVGSSWTGHRAYPVGMLVVGLALWVARWR